MFHVSPNFRPNVEAAVGMILQISNVWGCPAGTAAGQAKKPGQKVMVQCGKVVVKGHGMRNIGEIYPLRTWSAKEAWAAASIKMSSLMK